MTIKLYCISDYPLGDKYHRRAIEENLIQQQSLLRLKSEKPIKHYRLREGAGLYKVCLPDDAKIIFSDAPVSQDLYDLISKDGLEKLPEVDRSRGIGKFIKKLGEKVGFRRISELLTESGIHGIYDIDKKEFCIANTELLSNVSEVKPPSELPQPEIPLGDSDAWPQNVRLAYEGSPLPEQKKKFNCLAWAGQPQEDINWECNNVELRESSQVTFECWNKAGCGRVFIKKRDGWDPALVSEATSLDVLDALGVQTPKTIISASEDQTTLIIQDIGGISAQTLYERADYTRRYEIRRLVSKNFASQAIIGNYDAGTIHAKNIHVNGEVVCYIDPAAMEMTHDGRMKNDAEGLPFSWDEHIDDFFNFRHNNRRSYLASSLLHKTNGAILHELNSLRPKVEKLGGLVDDGVISEENYQIVRTRFNKASEHFSRLVDFPESQRKSILLNKVDEELRSKRMFFDLSCI
jgi:hypothetical protein